jgi:hypothetical protein
MATVMGGVGYGLYFVAKVGSYKFYIACHVLTLDIAIRLPNNRPTYGTTVAAR